MAEHWLSIVEYARNFSISDMTVRRRIKTGKLKAVLKDGKYFIPVHQLESSPHQQSDSSHANHTAQGSSRDLVNGRPSHLGEEHFKIQLGRQDSVGLPQVDPMRSDSIERRSPTVEGKQLPLVDPNALLAYCEQSLKIIEDKTKDHFRIILKEKDATIRNLELELNHAMQQIEDLQLLVKMIEGKTTT